MTLAVQRDATTAPSTPANHLFGPVSDFMMLGGATLFLFPLLVLLPGESLRPSFAVGIFLLSMVINYPHFAVSYRIFYGGYRAKASGVGATDSTLRYRYLFAGVVVPAVLAVALLVPMFVGSAELFGYAFHAMIFFVGWHYVKQGYGMAMVDAAFKRRFYNAVEKKVLLANAYAAWITAWLITYRYFAATEYLDVAVDPLPSSDPVFFVSCAVLAVTTAATAAMLGRRYLQGRPTAWTGTMAYMVSLYLWMVLVRFDPLVLLLAPALHSLQYLYVVKRFQINRRDADAHPLTWRGQYWRSVAMGMAMFWLVPMALDLTMGFDEAVFGALPYTFIFFIFINVHHYFLDNVMWRRGNADVSQHLFAAQR